MKNLQKIAGYLGFALALAACAGPAPNSPGAAARSVQIQALPAQLAVGERIELNAEATMDDGSKSSDLLWAFLDDSPTDQELETPLEKIWENVAVTPLDHHFYTTRAVYSNNRLMGRYPGTITIVAAARHNPKIRSKAVMQIVAAP